MQSNTRKRAAGKIFTPPSPELQQKFTARLFFMTPSHTLEKYPRAAYDCPIPWQKFTNPL
jgi:hypothetical protein